MKFLEKLGITKQNIMDSFSNIDKNLKYQRIK